MSALPPSEDPITPKKKAQEVDESKRWELFEQGIWTTKWGEEIHVSKMSSEHIKAVLRHIWTQCNFTADKNVWTAIELGAPAYKGTLCWDEWSGDLADPQVLWERHPFVEHATHELAVREVKYEEPWVDSIPF